ncbi:MAG TPA: SRPBCC family protein [Amycolatopsis sp.]|nr:SRPBCC family protein [Amycolatopsis sp.]
MREQRFRVQRQAAAEPSVIYRLLADVPGWRKWFPLVGHADFVRAGDAEPGGAGAIRRVGGMGFLDVEEQILDARAPHYQRYTVLRGLPVSSYEAEVHIEPLGTGSALLWTGRFSASLPGVGPVLRVVLGSLIGMLSTALVTAAERHASQVD